MGPAWEAEGRYNQRILDLIQDEEDTPGRRRTHDTTVHTNNRSQTYQGAALRFVLPEPPRTLKRSALMSRDYPTVGLHFLTFLT